MGKDLGGKYGLYLLWRHSANVWQSIKINKLAIGATENP